MLTAHKKKKNEGWGGVMAVPQPRILMFDITERSDGLSGFYTADYLLEDGIEVKTVEGN